LRPGPELIDALADEPSRQAYHLLPAVRGDLLGKLGRHDEAVSEFARAASSTRNVAERDLLLDRARAESAKADVRAAAAS
jgi:predicted RNA polymerase sigma factor